MSYAGDSAVVVRSLRDEVLRVGKQKQLVPREKEVPAVVLYSPDAGGSMDTWYKQ